MRTYIRILASCAVACAMALGMTACDPKGTIDGILTPTSVEEAIAAKEAQHAPTVSTPVILEEGYLTVGLRTAETTAPFCITQTGGEVMGMDIEIASLLADAMGLKVRFVNVTSVDAALGTECDIVMNVEVGNAGSATVVGAYSESASAVFRVGEAATLSTEDLAGRTVGLQGGSISQRLLSQTDLRMLETSYGNLNEAFEALAAGEVDYVCCDLYSGAYLASFYPGISLAGTLDVPTAEGIAVAADNTALQVNIQSALDTIQTNGLVALVRATWIAGMPNATNASVIQGLE